MTHALKNPLLVGAVALVLSLAIVPSAFAQGPITQTAILYPQDWNPDDGIDFAANVEGMVTIRRRPANNTMNWEVDAVGLTPGHSWTLWVGNFNENTDLGSGGGGLVGGSGGITAAGNHCIWPLDENEMDGGFVPGTAPDCSMIDVTKGVTFILLDHGVWQPGDVMAFWDPTGGIDNIPTYAGVAFGYIPPLED